jgi:hypothetical protein
MAGVSLVSGPAGFLRIMPSPGLYDLFPRSKRAKLCDSLKIIDWWLFWKVSITDRERKRKRQRERERERENWQ